MYDELKIGDNLVTCAPADSVAGYLRSSGEPVTFPRTPARVRAFQILGWLDVEPTRGKYAGQVVRMRQADLALPGNA